MRLWTRTTGALAMFAIVGACGDSTSDDPTPQSDGSAGSSGAAGSAGIDASAGSGGNAGSAGSGGNAGSSGSSGSSGSAGSGGGSPLAGKLLTEWVGQYCASVAACCSAVGATTAGCQQLAADPSVLAYFEAMLASPNVKFEQAKWEACLAKLAATAGDCDRLRFMDEPANCGLGTIAPGGACTKAYECSAPAGAMASCSSGVCGYQSVGIAGDGCSKSCGDFPYCNNPLAPNGAYCFQKHGLYCEPATLQCAALKGIGESCPGVYSCVADAYCDSGQCLAKKLAGATCTNDVQCLEGYCDAGLCVPLLSDGELCTSSLQCVGKLCPLGVGTCSSHFEAWWTQVCT